MKYSDLSDANDFFRNMQKTPWLKLFPHWWSEKDALLNAIGDEVERIKAQAIFTLLNSQIKPPVMVWQESLIHPEYHITDNITQLPSVTQVQAPLYKTWGKITLTNNTTEDIDTLAVMITQSDGFVITQSIAQSDKIVIDLIEDKVTLNNKKIKPQKIGEGIPYFKTVQNNDEYVNNTPLHNEAIKVEVRTEEDIECDIDIDIELKDVVFTNEQNIEVTGLELVPIEKVELYVKYDFEYNKKENGWHKVYEKEYDSNTNVLYDMITKQYYTKEFYVNVWYKTLQFPYQVAFPCYKDAEESSMYHVNTHLDTWGEQLGLERRLYKTDIDERVYAKTFPPYYPADIEQDYWYYKRLSNEYTWNDLAINDVDLKDTEGNNIIRLYSINPFVEDFVVHAKSTYTSDKEYVNFNKYIPKLVTQRSSDNNKRTQQTPFTNTKNVLKYDNNKTNVQLTNKSGLNVNNLKYMSKELLTYFDLSDLPNDINIDNIEVLVEAESTDSKVDKHSNDKTGVIVPSLYKDGDTTFIPLTADKDYQLSEQTITYSSDEIKDYIKRSLGTDKEIQQKATIGMFKYVKVGTELKIPFSLIENDEQVNDIYQVWLYFNDRLIEGKYSNGYIIAPVPLNQLTTQITIVCKSNVHAPFTTTIDISTETQYIDDETKEPDDNGEKPKIAQLYINGPLVDNKASNIEIEENWHTNDFRNILQREGLYFRNILENDNIYSSTSINIKNIVLKVSYSPKKTHFNLYTTINKKVTGNKIGEYNVYIKNTGEKRLQTYIDIINAPNIRLSENIIDVELDIGEKLTKTIDIYKQLPIDDGFYDILAVCEDVTCKDIIEVSSQGLIQTGINLKYHHAKYNQENTLTATLTTGDLSTISSEIKNLSFYINGYLIGTTNVIDNKATLKFTPSENGFLKTGILDLEVKYSGTSKYAASHKKNTIFISKDKTNIQINVSDIALYEQEYNIPVEVFDDNEENVVNGKINYYFDDIYLGEATAGLDKQFTLNIANLDIEPGKYTLYVRYTGDDNYSVSEESKEITIIGGHVNLYIDDVNTLPTDEKTLEVKVLDDDYNLVPSGYIYFDIDDLNIHITDIEVKNGKASSLLQLNNAPVGTYSINVTYQNSKITGYSNTTTTAILTIEKRKVNIERYAPYQGSQYEPLGFLFKVTDAITGDLINSGKIKLEVVSTNWDIPSVDVKDGYARIIHNPVTMTAKEWESLSNYQFFIGKEYPSRIINNITGEQVNVQDIDGFDINTYNNIVTRLDDLFGIWSGDGGFPEQENYFELVDGYLYYHSSSVDEDDDISEFLIIDNEGHLHQQTSDTHRKYDIKDYNLKLKFYDSPQYKDKTIVIEEGLHIDNNYDIDLDILLYNDLTYSSTTDTICYVTNTLTHENITSGQVIFKLDNQIFYTANVENGIAKIPTIKYFEIEKGNYLLEALYQKNSTEATHTYAHYSMGQIKPLISCNDFNKDRGQKSTVKVNLQTTGNINIGLLSGFVNAYLDGQLLNSLYLYGNEQFIGLINEKPSAGVEKITDADDIEFVIDIPDDVDEHNLTIVYEGNDLIESVSKSIDFVPAPAKVTLSCNPSKMAKGQPGVVEIFAIAKDYIINEGYINILDSNEKIVAHGNIRSNKATLKWTPIEGQYYTAVFGGSRLYECDNEYQIVSSEYYENLSKNDKAIALIIDIIDAVDYINLTEQPEYGTLQTAVQCLSDDGEIFIEEDYVISESVTINKNINIYGSNGAALIKDLPDLLSDLSNIKIYATSSNLYEVEGLTQYQLNEKDFIIQDGDIYTLKDYNKLYLMSDGKFYSEKELKLQDILTDVIITITGDASVSIDNLVFKSNDKDSNKYRIDNIGNLKITHSIIEESVRISSSGFLRVNNSLVYGRISSSNYNLDNNWWGSNNPPHKVNNNIILTLDTAEYPPVISEDINIIGKLIGANDRHYDIPDADFILEAETGYFGIDSGKMINGEINTSYMDATAENPVTITVDNQSVSTQIYDYARKTEVIIDSIPEIPYGYYVPINAEIRSCADSYFDLDREIDGYINFFLDNKQVGHVPIKNNIATLVLYSKYDIGNEYELKAIYEPKEYYFKSESLLKFNIIDDTGVVYVSSSGGNDYGDGSFDSPFKTIQKALTTQNHTIYLKDKNYQESELNINKPVTIKSYCNNVVFKNIEGNYIFNTNNNGLTLSNINFIDNLANTLFSNNSIITAQYCTFVNNKQLFTTSDNIIILYSVIIDNDSIADTIKPQNFQYCWFGTNTPRTDINSNINNYIIMKVDATKKEEDEIILYNGIVTRLTATLRHYKQHINNNEFEYSLSEDIPLRIANFISDDFLFLPKKDYTYHNYATSLLDTNKQSDNDTIKLKISGTTQYINNNVEITCQVTNQLNEQLNDGFVNFLIRYNDKIYANENIEVQNGEAVLRINPLRKGEYVLECTYDGYVKSTTLIVKKEDLWVQSLDISDSDNAYNLSINGIFGNSLSKDINNENVNILIDDILIDICKINNNSISKVLNYPMLKAGKHSLEIVYDGEKYDEYSYLTYFTSKEKETEITFNYDFIEAGIVNYLDIYINDNEKPVTKGYIDVLFNNEKIVENAEITNGYYQLSIPTIHDTNIKQHSIFIIYSGYSGYYKESTYNKDNISSGIFGIKSDLPDIVYADIDAPFNINSKIIDMNGQPVFRGSVDVYINDILVLNDINISNSHIITSATLPNGIKPGKHSLRIEYCDDTNIYLDTIIQRELQIKSLDTVISLKPYDAYPNEEVTIEYEVTSSYGNVNNGVITFNINDIIYSKEVSDGLFNQITFRAPNLPANIYDMTVNYKDKDNTYNESSLETQFILNKNTLNIEPSHTWYYPKKSFIFTATFTNNDGARANNGFASIYIDGVKEKENIKVINGQASTYLEFDNVKKYEITIVYEENDYHEESSYTYDFFTNTIPINNITFDYNNSKINTVIFETKDNINVYDGVLDIKIDDEYIKTIFITESNKALDLDISHLSKGKHEVNIKYYDSSMFDNYKGVVDIYIEPKTLDISIKEEEIYAQIDSYIDVPIELTDTISGTIKYYINNDMYIGMSNIQNDNQAVFKFKVPISFTDETYNITAKFIGNEFYNESISNTATLFIQKHESYIYINNEENIEAFYQENINLNIDTNIEGNLSVFLKIYDKNNEILSSDNLLISQDNDTIYQLNSYLTEGEYTIDIYYPGSIYYNEYGTSCKLIVSPYTPLINENDIYSETNIGGVITLNSLVKNINDVPIFDVGNFRYVIDDIGYEVELNNTINIDVENQEVDKILCYYVSDDHTKYLDTEIEINATYIKNELNAHIIDSREDLYILKEASDSNGNIDLSTSTISSAIHNKDTNFIKSLTLEDDKIISNSIVRDNNKTISSNLEDAITDIQLNNESNIEYNYVKDVYNVNNRMSVDMLNISRGGQYEWNIFAESLTTSIIPNDIPYTIYIEQENENITLYSGTIENGESKAIINIPITLSYQDQYKIIFTTEETSVFKALTKEVIVNNNNQDIIYVDPEAETDTINTVKTLSNAVELVRDNGIINIKNDITENNEIEINKNITIESDKKTLTNCSIINNAELDIDNVIFDNTLTSANAKSFIVNNNSTKITSCIFKNNKKSAIYSNKILEIYDTEFVNNSAQSGSCIYINNKNYNTVVKRCKFNENNAQNYGSCIYSDKGNDLNISYSSFTNNNASNYTGQCICVTGNIYIYSVYFYNNMGESEIRLNDGVLEIDKSLFDNKIKPITINNGLLKANTNYWGTNNVEEDIIKNPEVNLKIDSWVNASYNVEEDESEYRITVLANEYINTSEKEIKTIENLNNNFPIKINGESTTLNNTMTIPKPVTEIIVKVGSSNEKVV